MTGVVIQVAIHAPEAELGPIVAKLVIAMNALTVFDDSTQTCERLLAWLCEGEQS